MRRLAYTTSADALLRAGALGHDELWLVAGVLARFYAAAAGTPRYGSLAMIEANLAESFEQARPFVGRFLDAATLDAVRAWQVGFLARHRDRFEARIDRHRIREGHGDLRLEHVYLEEGRPLIIDCTEFNERFRTGDVASDVAFLAMELEARGHPDLAGSFLGRFALESDHYDLYDVVDFYLSYRAWVRGKVAAFLAADPSTPPDKARRKAEEA
jgi:aminoglycoside phosphotransferase family enzyme